MNLVNIVMYHYVRELKNGRYNKIKGLETEHFVEQLDFFQKNYNIIRMEDLIDSIENSTKLPEKALLLTFDDGYLDHFNIVFPILANRDIQGSFFIPAQTFCENKLLDVNKIHFILACADIETLYIEVLNQINFYRREGYELPSTDSLIEKYAIANRFDDEKTIFVKRILQTALPEDLRGIIASNLFKKYIGLPEDVFARELYLNREQIQCMKDSGMFIGLHGYNHYWLGNLDKDLQEKEIKKALSEMSDFIDKDNWVMNYPYGSYNKDTLDILEKLNCKLAFTTEVEVCNLSKHNRFELPRLDTIDFPPRSDNYLKYEVKYESFV